MSAPERRRYVIKDKRGAMWVGNLISVLDPGWSVTLAPPGRSPPQNRTFHDLCDDIAKARPVWNDLPMTADDWKQLLVHGHALATDGSGVRLTKDLEGHGLIQLRESTARMSKARATSLIDYTVSWAVSNGIAIKIPGDQ